MALQALKSQLNPRYQDLKECLAIIFTEDEILSLEKRIILALCTSYVCESHELCHFLEAYYKHELGFEVDEEIKTLVPLFVMKGVYNESLSILGKEMREEGRRDLIKESLEKSEYEESFLTLMYFCICVVMSAENCLKKAEEHFLSLNDNEEKIIETIKITAVVKALARAFKIDNKGPVIV